MKTVTHIHLHGRTYALEEAGYSALRSYLDGAAQNLEGNPDKEEILKDFDLAVAEKCDAYLQPGKQVITAEEVAAIIREMGPVEGPRENTSEETPESKTETTAKPKKLYRVREGQMIAGVCTGLAAYFDVDVTLVRIIFIALGFITHGGWLLVYLIMIAVIPTANTSSEKARAFGTMQMTASELLKQAREGYSNFKNSEEWRRWKHQMKEERKRWKQQYRHHRYSPLYDIMQSIVGLVWVMFIVYISWFGYYHVAPVHDFFNWIYMLIERLMSVIQARIAR